MNGNVVHYSDEETDNDDANDEKTENDTNTNVEPEDVDDGQIETDHNDDDEQMDIRFVGINNLNNLRTIHIGVDMENISFVPQPRTNLWFSEIVTNLNCLESFTISNWYHEYGLFGLFPMPLEENIFYKLIKNNYQTLHTLICSNNEYSVWENNDIIDERWSIPLFLICNLLEHKEGNEYIKYWIEKTLKKFVFSFTPCDYYDITQFQGEFDNLRVFFFSELEPTIYYILKHLQKNKIKCTIELVLEDLPDKMQEIYVKYFNKAIYNENRLLFYLHPSQKFITDYFKYDCLTC